MLNLKFAERTTNYGAKQVLLKNGNKILAWIESYPKYTAVDEEDNKYFYAFGKPSDNNYLSFRVDTIAEGKQKILENLVL